MLLAGVCDRRTILPFIPQAPHPEHPVAGLPPSAMRHGTNPASQLLIL